MRQEKYWQRVKQEGFDAAKRGLSVDALDAAHPIDPGSRNAWLIGWRNGGGDILTGLVKVEGEGR